MVSSRVMFSRFSGPRQRPAARMVLAIGMLVTSAGTPHQSKALAWTWAGSTRCFSFMAIFGNQKPKDAPVVRIFLSGSNATTMMI